MVVTRVLVMGLSIRRKMLFCHLSFYTALLCLNWHKIYRSRACHNFPLPFVLFLLRIPPLLLRGVLNTVSQFDSKKQASAMTIQ